MRRLIIWIMLLCLVLLSACGADSTQPETSTTAATTGTTATTKAAATASTTTTTAATTAKSVDFSQYAPNVTYEVLAGKSAPDDALALVIYAPDEEALNEAVLLQKYQYDTSGERLLLGPRFDGEKMQVFTLEWDEESASFAPDEELFFVNYSEDGTALLLEAQIDGDRPQLALAVTIGTCTTQLMLCADATDTGAGREYMTAMPE